jgi:hypothetical protein
VLRPGTGEAQALGADGTTQLVYLLRPLPSVPAAAIARLTRGADGDAAVQVAAQLSVGSGLGLVLGPAGRHAASVAADLRKRGLRVSSEEGPGGGIVVAAAAGSGPDAAPHDGDTHLAVIAGTNEASDDMDNWVQALNEAQPDNGQDPDGGQGAIGHDHASSQQEAASREQH